jgi:hypothetical protein
VAERRLSAIQERFYALVTHPEGVAPALAAEPGAPPLEEMVRGDRGLGAVDRLDVYANMYFYRLLDVLRDAYPKLTAAVGDTAFHNLVTEYLVACRPHHPTIEAAGDRLPQFLAGHPLAADRPWLVPLARLERTYTELFDGPDAAAMTLPELQALPPEELTALPLALIPCHRLLAADFAVAAVWDAPDEAADAPAERELLLVWRHDGELFHRSVPADEEPLLAAAATGATLQALCDLASATPSTTTEDAAQRVFQTVARWLADGIVRR